MPTAKDILGTYLHFQNNGQAKAIDVSESFWGDLAAGNHPELDQGRLMSAFTFSEPWSMWERHPAGDELVMLLSGAVTLVLDRAGVEESFELSSPGSFVLVPRGCGIQPGLRCQLRCCFLRRGLGLSIAGLGGSVGARRT